MRLANIALILVMPVVALVAIAKLGHFYPPRHIFKWFFLLPYISLLLSVISFVIRWKDNGKVTEMLTIIICLAFLAPVHLPHIITGINNHFNTNLPVDLKLTTPLHQAASNGRVATVKKLLQAGANPDVKTLKTKYTPLMKAASRGQKEVCQVLIDGRAEVNLKNSKGQTALFMAVLAKDSDIVSYLLSQGAQPNIKSTLWAGDLDLAPIHLAVKNESLIMVQLLVRAGAKIDIRTRPATNFKKNEHSNSYGLTALYLASQKGNTEIVQFLLKNGANVSIPSFGKQTPLHVAQNAEIAKMLIENGADVNAVSDEQKTPLHLVKDANIAKVLMKNYAAPNVNNKEPVAPPLLSAASNGNLEVCKVLVEGGVDVNQQDERGRTALFRAVQAKKTDVLSYLLSHGANPNILGEGIAPIHKAIKNNSIETIQILANAGANIDIQTKDHHVDSYGMTPIYLASQKGQIEIVQFLLDNGADVTIRTEYKATPLHVAQNAKIAQLLIDHGADVNAIQEYHQTPLHSARDADIARVLIKNGANLDYIDSKYIPMHPPLLLNQNPGVQMELLKAGADIHLHGRGNQTILHNTIDPEVITLAVNEGLDINAKDNWEHTPLYYASTFSLFYGSAKSKANKALACALIKKYGGINQ